MVAGDWGCGVSVYIDSAGRITSDNATMREIVMEWIKWRMGI